MPDAFIPSYDSFEVRITPAAASDLDAIVNLDEEALGPTSDDLVPVSVYHDWWMKNSEVFTCLRSRRLPLAGYYSLLPLQSSALDRFIAGRFRERELTGRDILSTNDAADCSRLYLFSFVMRASFSSYTTLLAQHLVHRIRALWQNSALREIYAVAATPDGEATLERFGFLVQQHEQHRLDGHPLYVATLCQDLIEQWTARFSVPMLSRLQARIAPTPSSSRPVPRRAIVNGRSVSLTDDQLAAHRCSQDWDVFVDKTRMMYRVARKDVRLRPKGKLLLSFFASHPGKLITYDEILGVVWPGLGLAPGNPSRKNRIWRAVSDEVKKATQDLSPPLLESVYGEGYLVREDLRACIVE